MQESDYEFVHRAVEKTKREWTQIPDELLPGWLDGEHEQLVEPKPEPCSMEEAVQRVKQCQIPHVSTDPMGTGEGEASRSPSPRDEQQKDSAFALFRRWTGTDDDPNQAALPVRQITSVVADMLTKYCAKNLRSWLWLVPYLTFVYNTTVHRKMGVPPFRLVYGAEFQYPTDLYYPRQLGS